MDNISIVLIAAIIFLAFVFLFFKLIKNSAKDEYSKKLLKHWPTRLSYWQAIILNSSGSTIVTIFVLKWANILV
jgi:hypothetical protein